MPRARADRRYLALVFPWLPIERLRNSRPHLFVAAGETPVAFVETVGRTTRLTAVDAAAARAGLEPGTSLAEARARLPALEVFPADPHADMDWLERLADGCARYSPTVAPMPPDALVIDVAGRTDAFGGERPLAADIEARLARRGILVRHAFGATPAIACALARHAGAPAPDEARAVRRLPVAALELDAEDAATLARSGLKTVGDVMALPPAAVATRFGREVADAVLRLSGDHAAPVRAHTAPVAVAVERRLAEPIARADHILATIEELAAEAMATLADRQQGGRRWLLRLFRADGLVERLQVETGRPTRDVAWLMRLLAARLGTLADPPDSGSGYDLVRLDVLLAERIDAAELRLEGGGARPEPAAQEQPVAPPPARTGRTRRRAPRHDPHSAQAELMLPAIDDAPAAGQDAQAGEPPQRPIHLFDPPLRIDGVEAEPPDGPPHRFRWRRRMHEVARAEGPERLAGEWWRHPDTAVPTRDYYRVEDRRGRRFWIFRHGPPGDTGSPRWYLHGLFA